MIDKIINYFPENVNNKKRLMKADIYFHQESERLSFKRGFLNL